MRDASDLNIDSAKLGWTVSQLKHHIRLVHPDQPSTAEQRLVYAGRLLQDHHRLSDVLRHFQPGEKQCIHLITNKVSEAGPSAGASAHASRDVATPTTPTTSEGLRRRRPADPAGSASPADPAVGVTPSPEQQQFQAAQLAVVAHQYAYAAQTYAAMGYSPELVGAYSQYAEYYSSWSQHLSSPSSPAAVAASPVAGAVPAVPAAPTEPAVEEPVAAGRFAEAGHAAQPAFVDPEEPAAEEGNNLRHRVLEQLALILKLTFFMVYFGSHVTGWRYVALLLLCLATLLYQGGWMRAADNENGHDNDNARADVGMAADGVEGQEADAADAPSEAEQDQPGPAEDAPSAADPEVAAELIHAAATQQHEPRSLASMLGTIVFKFFASMVPGTVRAN